MNGLSLEEIKKEIQQLDPGLDPHDESTFRTAVVLLAAAFATGPDTERLTTFTGYPGSFVIAISQRMRHFGLWTDREVHAAHWFKGDKWTPGLWMDSLVAQGLMLVRRREDGEWEYRALKQGLSESEYPQGQA
jgi:hypothetical protein